MTTTASALAASATPNAGAGANTDKNTDATPTGSAAGAGQGDGGQPKGKTDADLKKDVEAIKAAKAAADAAKVTADKDGEGKSSDDKGKPANGKSALASEPEAWTAKLPDGLTADKQLLDGVQAMVKEGLPGETAQKLVDLYASRVQEMNQAYEAEQTALLETAKKDSEIGGAKWDESLALARRALNDTKLVSPELKKLAEENASLGNHPEFLRLLVRVGKAIASDSVAGTTTAPATQTKDPLRARYNNPKSEALFRK